MKFKFFKNSSLFVVFSCPFLAVSQIDGCDVIFKLHFEFLGSGSVGHMKLVS